MSTILVERGTITTIDFNRPGQACNALNAELLGELHAALALLASATDVRCAIMTGAGDKAFAAGADIASMSKMDAGRSPEVRRARARDRRAHGSRELPHHRRDQRLCPRRRLRARAVLRFPLRERQGQARAAWRSTSRSSPASVAPNASPGASASGARASSCTPATRSTHKRPSASASGQRGRPPRRAHGARARRRREDREQRSARDRAGRQEGHSSAAPTSRSATCVRARGAGVRRPLLRVEGSARRHERVPREAKARVRGALNQL